MENNIKVDKKFINEHVNIIGMTIKKNQEIKNDSYASTTKVPSREPEIISSMMLATKKLYETITNGLTMIKNIEENYEKLDRDLENVATELNMTIISKEHQPVSLIKKNATEDLNIEELATKGEEVLQKYNINEKLYDPAKRASINNGYNTSNLGYYQSNNETNDNTLVNEKEQLNDKETTDNNQVSENATKSVLSTQNYQQNKNESVSIQEQKTSEETPTNSIKPESDITDNSNTNNINNANSNTTSVDESENNNHFGQITTQNVEKKNSNTQKAGNETLKTIGIVSAVSAAAAGIGYGVYDNLKNNNRIDDDDDDDNSKEEE